MTSVPLSTTFRNLNRLERILPYLIVVPFGYYTYKSGFIVKRRIVEDSKQGEIKRAFVHSWLKRVAVDEVMLKDRSLRANAVTFLEDLCRHRGMQMSALSLIVRGLHTEEMKTEGKDLLYNIFRVLLQPQSGFRAQFSDVMTSTSFFDDFHFILPNECENLREISAMKALWND